MMLWRRWRACSGSEGIRHEGSTVIEGERQRRLLGSRRRLIVFDLASLVEWMMGP